jgi:iron(III) transport system substrate-binding protein
MPSRPRRSLFLLLASLALLAAGCGGSGEGSGQAASGGGGQTVVIYSGRSEELIKPLLEQFTRATGIKAETRYGGSAELAAQLLEEGQATKADVFLSQDAGALGALAKQGRLTQLPPGLVAKVPERYRSDEGNWVGVSGRARVIVYNPEKVPEAQVPDSVFALTDPKWKGRVAVPPTNASFQAFVTAMRLTAGEERTRQWLKDLKANGLKTYESNSLVLKAVDDGEVDLGLINHYYLYEEQAETGKPLTARNAFLGNGDPGALVNVAGVGILEGADHGDAARRFVEYLLGPDAQRYFKDKTYEYPLIEGVQPHADLPELSTIEGPKIDLSDLASLQDTLKLLNEVGLT